MGAKPPHLVLQAGRFSAVAGDVTPRPVAALVRPRTYGEVDFSDARLGVRYPRKSLTESTTIEALASPREPFEALADPGSLLMSRDVSRSRVLLAPAASEGVRHETAFPTNNGS